MLQPNPRQKQSLPSLTKTRLAWHKDTHGDTRHQHLLPQTPTLSCSYDILSWQIRKALTKCILNFLFSLLKTGLSEALAMASQAQVSACLHPPKGPRAINLHRACAAASTLHCRRPWGCRHPSAEEGSPSHLTCSSGRARGSSLELHVRQSGRASLGSSYFS